MLNEQTKHEIATFLNTHTHTQNGNIGYAKEIERSYLKIMNTFTQLHKHIDTHTNTKQHSFFHYHGIERTNKSKMA